MTKQHIFLISLNEAHQYLVNAVCAMHNGFKDDAEDYVDIEDLFTSLLSALINDQIEYSSILNSVCTKLEIIGYSKMQARDLCDIVFKLIVDKIIEFIPGFSDDRYRGKMSYTLVRRATIMIKIESNVYNYYTKI